MADIYLILADLKKKPCKNCNTNYYMEIAMAPIDLNIDDCPSVKNVIYCKKCGEICYVHVRKHGMTMIFE